MVVSPISQKSKSEQVSEFIVSRIANGEWPPKTKIPNETELANMFGVSRISIRQAISHLNGQGILTVRQGDGTFVNEVLPQDYLGNVLQMVIMDTPAYLEIQEFRRIIEPMIAYAVAGHADAEALAPLKDCVKRQAQAKRRGNMEAYLQEDIQFHGLLAESSGNGLVIKTMHLVQDLLSLAMEHTGALSGFDDGVEYHQEICESLGNHDACGARDLMLRHIDNNIKLVKLENDIMNKEETTQ